MSSDSQSIDKVAVKVYDVQSGTTSSSDKVTECKVEVTREDGHGKNSDFSRESGKLDEEDDNETCHHSIDTVSLKKVVSTKTSTKVDRTVRSEKLRSQTGRRRESRFDDDKRRNINRKNGGGSSGRKVFLLPISSGGYSGCSSHSRNRRHHLCHIKSSQRNKYSHSHSFHGGNRVILITTPLSCCCCCQRKKR